MLSNTIRYFIALLALIISFSLFFHDTQVDRATSLALSLPTAAIITYAVMDKGIKTSETHTHIERSSGAKSVKGIRAMAPRLPARDDTRHTRVKKLYYSAGGDNVSLWPSV